MKQLLSFGKNDCMLVLRHNDEKQRRANSANFNQDFFGSNHEVVGRCRLHDLSFCSVITCPKKALELPYYPLHQDRDLFISVRLFDMRRNRNQDEQNTGERDTKIQRWQSGA